MAWVLGAAALAVFFIARGRRGASIAETGIERLCRLDGDVAREADAPRKNRSASLRAVFLDLPYRAAPPSIRRGLEAGLQELVPLSGFALERLAGMRAWAAACLPLAALLLLRFSPVAITAAPPLASLGFMLPKFLASRRRGGYLESVRGGLPQTADLLYTCVLGGRNLDQSFRCAAEAAPGPLGTMLRQAVREMELGASRDEAFARLTQRCPLPELSSLLRSILEAERRGHALSDTLEVYSREIRLRRRDELRATVAKAPLKMLAPLVFLILPASVLLTVGPTFLATLKNVF